MNGTNASMDLSNENFNTLRACQEIILNKALKQGIQRNEEQFKVWTDYKKRHKKVIEALEKLPLELSINCMVPVGKRAFMKGKLIHTNEVLACIGDGYFAKYSAAKAIALCNRRIQSTDEMLTNLEKERNLYEMRQFVCSELDVFGKNEKKDFTSHWDEKKLDDWRVEHRRREKEYRQKLSELRKKEKTEIKTEEDLFKRLDELELQEELADEMNRLEDEDEDYYEELEEEEEEEYNESDEEEHNVLYEEEEEENSEDQDDYEEIEKELNKLREIRMGRKMNGQSTESNIISNIVNTNKEISESNVTKSEKVEEKTLLKTIDESSCSNCNDENESIKVVAQPRITSGASEEEIKLKEKKRRVSFAGSDISIFDGNSEPISVKNQDKQSTVSSNDDPNDSVNNSDDDIIRIEFKHTDNNFSQPESTGNEITSPRDIYEIFSKPKSILKRSPNDVMPLQNISLPTYSSGEEEEEEEEEEKEKESAGVKPSAYYSIVKNISEKELATPKKKNDEVIKEKKKKPVSKFKMERSSCVK
ncbi:unconventional prefoldin RPB5 interactor-like protein [Polistes fuscatus]|uniref:unconventional prefoldin RPB5 interactor-like protein n=1 Tax=Polistes fuscatus TaxID=30207 RepID=UPI001CA87DFD|nr:unconventional prefoldin RPB5 interactor-like protein [Polistes fuscatus]